MSQYAVVTGGPSANLGVLKLSTNNTTYTVSYPYTLSSLLNQETPGSFVSGTFLKVMRDAAYDGEKIVAVGGPYFKSGDPVRGVVAKLERPWTGNATWTSISNDTLGFFWSNTSGSATNASGETEEPVIGYTGGGYGIAWNGQVWVATGQGGASFNIFQSYDGNAWTPASPTTAVFGIRGTKVVWNGEAWVVIGKGDPSSISTTMLVNNLDDGFSWRKPIGSQLSEECTDIAWNGTRWIAIGGPNVITSKNRNADEWQWVNFTQAAGEQLKSVTWTGQKWLIAGKSNIYESPDAFTWTLASNVPNVTSGWGISDRWIGARTAKQLPYTRYVVDDAVYSSVSGLNANVIATGTGDYGPVLEGRYNGTNVPLWVRSTIFPPGQKVYDILRLSESGFIFGGDLSYSGVSAALFYIAGSTLSAVTVSAIPSTLSVCRRLATDNSGRYFAVGEGLSYNTILRSSNGLAWSNVSSTFATAYDIAWNGTFWTAVGAGLNGEIATSVSGLSWTEQDSDLSIGYAVAWNGRNWLVGGDGQVKLVESLSDFGWFPVEDGISSLSCITTIAAGPNGWVVGGIGTSNGALTMYTNTPFDLPQEWVPAGYRGEYSTRLSRFARKPLFTLSVGRIAWASDRWVAVGTGNATIAESTDGYVWKAVRFIDASSTPAMSAGLGVWTTFSTTLVSNPPAQLLKLYNELVTYTRNVSANVSSFLATTASNLPLVISSALFVTSNYASFVSNYNTGISNLSGILTLSSLRLADGATLDNTLASLSVARRQYDITASNITTYSNTVSQFFLSANTLMSSIVSTVSAFLRDVSAYVVAGSNYILSISGNLSWESVSAPIPPPAGSDFTASLSSFQQYVTYGESFAFAVSDYSTTLETLIGAYDQAISDYTLDNLSKTSYETSISAYHANNLSIVQTISTFLATINTEFYSVYEKYLTFLNQYSRLNGNVASRLNRYVETPVIANSQWFSSLERKVTDQTIQNAPAVVGPLRSYNGFLENRAVEYIQTASFTSYYLPISDIPTQGVNAYITYIEKVAGISSYILGISGDLSIRLSNVSFLTLSYDYYVGLRSSVSDLRTYAETSVSFMISSLSYIQSTISFYNVGSLSVASMVSLIAVKRATAESNAIAAAEAARLAAKAAAEAQAAQAAAEKAAADAAAAAAYAAWQADLANAAKQAAYEAEQARLLLISSNVASTNLLLSQSRLTVTNASAASNSLIASLSTLSSYLPYVRTALVSADLSTVTSTSLNTFVLRADELLVSAQPVFSQVISFKNSIRFDAIQAIIADGLVVRGVGVDSPPSTYLGDGIGWVRTTSYNAYLLSQNKGYFSNASAQRLSGITSYNTLLNAISPYTVSYADTLSYLSQCVTEITSNFVTISTLGNNVNSAVDVAFGYRSELQTGRDTLLGKACFKQSQEQKAAEAASRALVALTISTREAVFDETLFQIARSTLMAARTRRNLSAFLKLYSLASNDKWYTIASNTANVFSTYFRQGYALYSKVVGKTFTLSGLQDDFTILSSYRSYIDTTFEDFFNSFAKIDLSSYTVSTISTLSAQTRVLSDYPAGVGSSWSRVRGQISNQYAALRIGLEHPTFTTSYTTLPFTVSRTALSLYAGFAPNPSPFAPYIANTFPFVTTSATDISVSNNLIRTVSDVTTELTQVLYTGLSALSVFQAISAYTVSLVNDISTLSAIRASIGLSPPSTTVTDVINLFSNERSMVSNVIRTLSLYNGNNLSLIRAFSELAGVAAAHPDYKTIDIDGVNDPILWVKNPFGDVPLRLESGLGIDFWSYPLPNVPAFSLLSFGYGQFFEVSNRATISNQRFNFTCIFDTYRNALRAIQTRASNIYESNKLTPERSSNILKAYADGIFSTLSERNVLLSSNATTMLSYVRALTERDSTRTRLFGGRANTYQTYTYYSNNLTYRISDEITSSDYAKKVYFVAPYVNELFTASSNYATAVLSCSGVGISAWPVRYNWDTNLNYTGMSAGTPNATRVVRYNAWSNSITPYNRLVDVREKFGKLYGVTGTAGTLGPSPATGSVGGYLVGGFYANVNDYGRLFAPVEFTVSLNLNVLLEAKRSPVAHSNAIAFAEQINLQDATSNYILARALLSDTLSDAVADVSTISAYYVQDLSALLVRTRADAVEWSTQLLSTLSAVYPSPEDLSKFSSATNGGGPTLSQFVNTVSSAWTTLISAISNSTISTSSLSDLFDTYYPLVDNAYRTYVNTANDRGYLEMVGTGIPTYKRLEKEVSNWVAFQEDSISRYAKILTFWSNVSVPTDLVLNQDLFGGRDFIVGIPPTISACWVSPPDVAISFNELFYAISGTVPAGIISAISAFTPKTAGVEYFSNLLKQSYTSLSYRGYLLSTGYTAVSFYRVRETLGVFASNATLSKFESLYTTLSRIPYTVSYSLSGLSETNFNVYDPDWLYYEGDIVSYSNQLYLCCNVVPEVTPSKISGVPPTDSNAWLLVATVSQGFFQWNPTEVYNPGAIVMHSNTLYQSIKQTFVYPPKFDAQGRNLSFGEDTSVQPSPPPNPEYWVQASVSQVNAIFPYPIYSSASEYTLSERVLFLDKGFYTPEGTFRYSTYSIYECVPLLLRARPYSYGDVIVNKEASNYGNKSFPTTRLNNTAQEANVPRRGTAENDPWGQYLFPRELRSNIAAGPEKAFYTMWRALKGYSLTENNTVWSNLTTLTVKANDATTVWSNLVAREISARTLVSATPFRVEDTGLGPFGITHVSSLAEPARLEQVVNRYYAPLFARIEDIKSKVVTVRSIVNSMKQGYYNVFEVQDYMASNIASFVNPVSTGDGKLYFRDVGFGPLRNPPGQGEIDYANDKGRTAGNLEAIADTLFGFANAMVGRTQLQYLLEQTGYRFKIGGGFECDKMKGAKAYSKVIVPFINYDTHLIGTTVLCNGPGSIFGLVEGYTGKNAPSPSIERTLYFALKEYTRPPPYTMDWSIIENLITPPSPGVALLGQIATGAVGLLVSAFKQVIDPFGLGSAFRAQFGAGTGWPTFNQNACNYNRSTIQNLISQVRANNPPSNLDDLIIRTESQIFELQTMVKLHQDWINEYNRKIINIDVPGKPVPPSIPTPKPLPPNYLALQSGALDRLYAAQRLLDGLKRMQLNTSPAPVAPVTPTPAPTPPPVPPPVPPVPVDPPTPQIPSAPTPGPVLPPTPITTIASAELRNFQFFLPGEAGKNANLDAFINQIAIDPTILAIAPGLRKNGGDLTPDSLTAALKAAKPIANKFKIPSVFLTSEYFKPVDSGNRFRTVDLDLTALSANDRSKVLTAYGIAQQDVRPPTLDSTRSLPASVDAPTVPVLPATVSETITQSDILRNPEASVVAIENNVAETEIRANDMKTGICRDAVKYATAIRLAEQGVAEASIAAEAERVANIDITNDNATLKSHYEQQLERYKQIEDARQLRERATSDLADARRRTLELDLRRRTAYQRRDTDGILSLTRQLEVQQRNATRAQTAYNLANIAIQSTMIALDGAGIGFEFAPSDHPGLNQLFNTFLMEAVSDIGSRAVFFVAQKASQRIAQRAAVSVGTRAATAAARVGAAQASTLAARAAKGISLASKVLGPAGFLVGTVMGAYADGAFSTPECEN